MMLINQPEIQMKEEAVDIVKEVERVEATSNKLRKTTIK